MPPNNSFQLPEAGGADSIIFSKNIVRHSSPTRGHKSLAFKQLLMMSPCCSWHYLTTCMDHCGVRLLPSAGWGYNVCWQRGAVVTAAVTCHSNPISPISLKWSSQQEIFPNYLTTISLTTRLKTITTSFQTSTGFDEFYDSCDDLFPTTITYPKYHCTEGILKMPEKTQKTDYTGLIPTKLIIQWPGERL